MSRSARLLDLLQLLRRHRRPVTGAVIASELGISLRTLYRDIATLQAQGAHIDGAPGLGYQLRDGFVLPPLMFSVDEIEALVLGSRWVVTKGDSGLSSAARDALAKIAAVLPAALKHEFDSNALLIGPGGPVAVGDLETTTIRQAMRREQKLAIRYRDKDGKSSERTIWPFALGYFEQTRVLAGWCELRESVRHFRADRIESIRATGERYPRRRQALLKEWREQQGIGIDAADGN